MISISKAHKDDGQEKKKTEWVTNKSFMNSNYLE